MKRCVFRCGLVVLLMLLLVSMAAASGSQTKLVALTFDDGPCQYTDGLLDGLAERGAKATFFVQGVRAEQYPELICRMIAEGHQVGNHSYDHPNLSQISLQEALDQLQTTDAILDEITGGSGGYAYRAPYGSSTPAIRKKMGAPFFKWSVDTLDWSVRHAWTIQKNLMDHVHDGAIVLCHDTVFETTEGILWAIDQLLEQGYEFVTVEELCRRRGVDPRCGCSDCYDCLPNDVTLDGLKRPVVTTEELDGCVQVWLESEPGVPVYYTTDGSSVLYDAELYTDPFTVTRSCEIRAVSALNLNGSRSEEIVFSVEVGEISPAEEPEVEITDHTCLTRGLLAQLLYEAAGMPNVRACSLFADVPLSHPQADAVTWAYASGIFDGTGGDTFEPNRRLSREETAKVLASMLGLEPVELELTFRDTHKISGWAYDAVCAVLHAGLMQGGSDGYFHPQDTITGYEIRLILDRLATTDF